jgi:hypothetical protein
MTLLFRGSLFVLIVFPLMVIPWSTAEAWNATFNLGEQKTLVLLVEWDDLPLTITSDEAQTFIFGPDQSLADFYSNGLLETST